jgi:limonene-1,2-epoxide hydrolase
MSIVPRARAPYSFGMTTLRKGIAEAPDPREVVEAYVAAFAARDFDGARTWLADQHFRSLSPISEYDNADVFIESISRVGPILEGIERRKIFVDGNDVCLILSYVTRMDHRQVSPVVHWFRVESGKIVFIESFFDARAYAEMFEVD